MKQLIASYSFNTSSKTVTLTDFTTVRLDRLLLIANVTTGTILYNFTDSTLKATVSTNIVTLNSGLSLSGMSNTDQLEIFYDSLSADPTYDTQKVAVSSALPAGSNAIGKLAANGNVNIGDVGSLWTTVSGSATALNSDAVASTDAAEYRWVSLHVTNTYAGTLSFQVSNDNVNWVAAPLQLTTNTSNTLASSTTVTNSIYYGPIQGRYFRVRMTAWTSGQADVTAVFSSMPSALTSIGAQVGTVATLTGGGVAHGSADSGNPIKVGFKAKAALSGVTLASADNRTDSYADLDGAHLVRANGALGDTVNGNVSNTDGTSTQVIAAQGAGIKTYLTDFTITNTSSVATYCEIKDGATVKWTVPVPANGGITHSFTTPLGGTANTAWNFDMGAATTTAYASFSGFKSKI